MTAATKRAEPLATAASGYRRVRAIRELPGPRGLPLLGNILQLDTGRMHTILSKWADEFGPMYRYRVAKHDALVVADPDLINDVLRNRPDGFRRGKRMQAIVLELGVDGVFNAEGAKWRRQRKLAMLALNTNHLREFFTRLEVVTARLQRRWERAAAAGETVDASADLRRFTVDVTSSLAFATDLNTLESEGDVIQRHLDKVFPAIARRLFAFVPYWRCSSYALIANSTRRSGRCTSWSTDSSLMRADARQVTPARNRGQAISSMQWSQRKVTTLPRSLILRSLATR
jgi:cytochrome P450